MNIKQPNKNIVYFIYCGQSVKVTRYTLKNTRIPWFLTSSAKGDKPRTFEMTFVNEYFLAHLSRRLK